jgi:PIN like domain
MTSEPPPASSWATPPEFYTDENTVTRAVRRRLTSLGYIAHTPAELYGTWDDARGAADEDWLKRVAGRGWTIIGRDVKIYERPDELAAYKAARVQVFLLPGQAKSAELVQLIEINLLKICTITTLRQVGTWRLTKTGPEPYDVAEAEKAARRRTRRSQARQ